MQVEDDEEPSNKMRDNGKGKANAKRNVSDQQQEGNDNNWIKGINVGEEIDAENESNYYDSDDPPSCESENEDKPMKITAFKRRACRYPSYNPYCDVLELECMFF